MLLLKEATANTLYSCSWNTSGVAGVYSSQTNVWQIGHILGQLVATSNDTVRPAEIFRPAANWNINGAPAKGRTFLPLIWEYTNYSERLRSTVLESLYEKPAHRPTLWELKTRARDGYAAALAADDAARAVSIPVCSLLRTSISNFLSRGLLSFLNVTRHDCYP